MVADESSARELWFEWSHSIIKKKNRKNVRSFAGYLLFYSYEYQKIRERKKQKQNLKFSVEQQHTKVLL